MCLPICTGEMYNVTFISLISLLLKHQLKKMIISIKTEMHLLWKLKTNVNSKFKWKSGYFVIPTFLFRNVTMHCFSSLLFSPYMIGSKKGGNSRTDTPNALLRAGDALAMR